MGDILTPAFIVSVLAAAVASGTALLFACLGELITERAAAAIGAAEDRIDVKNTGEPAGTLAGAKREPSSLVQSINSSGALVW